MTTPEIFETEIVRSRPLAPAVKEFVLRRKDGRTFEHAPGQWVNLILPLPEGEIRRAYSIASAPSGSAEFELAVTRVTDGPGSGYLSGLDVGAHLRAIGPQGFFTRDPQDPAPALFVATGTGVTPLRSMLHAAVSSRSDTPLWLLLGTRKQEDLLYRDELTNLMKSRPNVRAHFTLSQGDAGWSGRRGYVQDHVPELWNALSALGQGEPHLYVCGLERMVRAVRDLARGPLGAPRQRVHSERYD